MDAATPKDRRVKPSAADVHHALLGRGGPLVIVHQAYRLSPQHSDELVVLRAGREFWVAARLGDQTNIWACHDLDSAEDTFEQMSRPEDGWRRARPDPARPAV